MLKFIRLICGVSILFATTMSAVAQGVAPGGPIGGSTGIGSGLGGVTGTGPSFPNGTNQAPQPTITPVAPSGGSSSAAPAGSAIAPSRYPSAGASTESYRRKPSTEPMSLPPSGSGDSAFLRGCWRTDVYQYEQHNGLTTWCFNEKGAGRVLYTRIDQPSYSCNAQANARYVAGVLQFHSLTPTCSDGKPLALGDLDCRQNGEVVHCSGTIPALGPGERWAVGLYKVPR